MKNKILLGLLVLIGLFTISGCGISKNNNQGNNEKIYNVNGINIKLDKEDDRDNIKYKMSSSFTRVYRTTMSTYTIYKDASKDKYDLANIVFRLDVNVDIMNTESRIEKEKKLVKAKDNFKNIEQNQKTINGTIWEYFTFDNTNDAENIFKEHLYITEKKVNNYYNVYKIYFSFANDIEEFEESFMNSIVFE